MKILQVNNTMDIGGIESFLMNIIRNIDLKVYNISFLTYSDKTFDFEDEINKYKCKILRISNPKKVTIIHHYIELKRIIKKGNYDVVHCHTYFDSALVMLAAKKSNVKIRITHSHTTMGLSDVSIIKKFKRNICRKIIQKNSTKLIACSTQAGRALFNNSDFEIMPNGIDFKKFKYDLSKRNKVRKDLKINEKIKVIGHVGRLNEAKNHLFLLDVFFEYLKINPNSVLVLIGDGEKKKQIVQKIKKMGINSKVVLLGSRFDVNNLINSFDVVVFPSIYEGLPLSLLELQANGLQCIVSDIVSKEVAITKCITYMSLNDSPKKWAELINDRIVRLETFDVVDHSIYSINETIKKLKLLYNCSGDKE